MKIYISLMVFTVFSFTFLGHLQRGSYESRVDGYLYQIDSLRFVVDSLTAEVEQQICIARHYQNTFHDMCDGTYAYLPCAEAMKRTYDGLALFRANYVPCPNDSNRTIHQMMREDLGRKRPYMYK